MPVAKRLFDFFAALFGLVVLAPVMAAVALAVRLMTPGPVIFAQTRVGREERPFTCYKFRTMQVGTAQRATHETDASAVTPLGATLRRYKLDELPQLWNVLRGDMSLVGPRPCLPVQSELIRERRERGVFALRPGITGLAQTEGIDMSNPARLAARDADYLRSHSLIMDLKLIVRTLFPG